MAYKLMLIVLYAINSIYLKRSTKSYNILSAFNNVPNFGLMFPVGTSKSINNNKWCCNLL